MFGCEIKFANPHVFIPHSTELKGWVEAVLESRQVFLYGGVRNAAPMYPSSQNSIVVGGAKSLKVAMSPFVFPIAYIYP